MKIVVVEEVDSTMNEVKKYDFNTLLVAKKQTNGRGKGNRNWVSEESNNIYMSLLIKADNEKINYFNYSFVTAISVIKALNLLTKNKIKLQAKWPNDVLINGKKFCGILLEKDADKLVIGVGINVDSYPENTMFNSTSLKNEGFDLEKGYIVELFADAFEEFSNELIFRGFPNIRINWLTYAYNFSKRITVKNEKNDLEGIFENLDQDGTLILRTDDGEIHKIASGDVF